MRIPIHLLAQANKARQLILAGVAINLLMWLAHPANADTVSFTGDLRADATFLPPDPPPFTDGDYAQFAAVVRTFNVSSTSLMEAITFSYGGGTNGNSMVIAQGGFEPYLSLFDSGGNFLASTLFGATCPSGAQTNSNSGQCFDVLLDGTAELLRRETTKSPSRPSRTSPLPRTWASVLWRMASPVSATWRKAKICIMPLT